MRSFPHILARAIGVPLAFHPAKARTIADLLLPRIIGNSVHVVGPDAIDHDATASRGRLGKVGDPLGRAYEAAGYGDELLERDESIGIIRVEGTLINKGAWIGSYSGDTSYEGIQAQVKRAARDRSIDTVVYEVDSFGGEVAGAFETADLISALAEKKKSVAILTDFALSAGYLLAAATGNIVIPETGRAGSIGVVSLYMDYSKQMDDAGVRVTILMSGKHKADGNPFEALPPEVAERITADLNATRDLFAGAIGRYRGRRMSKLQALQTEAQDYRGPEALSLGLVDAVMAPDVAYQRIRRSARR